MNKHTKCISYRLIICHVIYAISHFINTLIVLLLISFHTRRLMYFTRTAIFKTQKSCINDSKDQYCSWSLLSLDECHVILKY